MRSCLIVLVLTGLFTGRTAFAQTSCDQTKALYHDQCSRDALNQFRAKARIEWAKACGALNELVTYEGAGSVDEVIQEQQVDFAGAPQPTLMYPSFTTSDLHDMTAWYAPAPFGITAADCAKYSSVPGGYHPCVWCPAFVVPVKCTGGPGKCVLQ